jgi:hypothetical protein
MNKIDDLDLKFKYKILKYKFKDKLVASDATKASDIGSLQNIFFIRWIIIFLSYQLLNKCKICQYCYSLVTQSIFFLY